jgi:hypothetical protein
MKTAKLRAGIVAAALGAALVAAPRGIAAASPGPAASARTYANENDGCTCREQTIETYRPSGRYYIERGGPEFWARAGIRWTYWQSTARGTAYLYGADGGVFYLGHVTLYLYDRSYSTTYDEWYFRKLHIIGGNHVAHHFIWSWTYQDWNQA